MKKIYSILLLLAATYAITSAETVTISTQEEFNAFVNRVNKGEPSLDAMLTADVTTNQHIGTETNKYCGKFNGGGNTITINYQEETLHSVSLFRYVENATIFNLNVAGDILTKGEENINNGKFSAAFVGESFDITQIINCISRVNIRYNPNGQNDASQGALVGINNGMLIIKNCAALGSFGNANTGANTSLNFAGFVGWNASKNIIIEDSYIKQTYVDVLIPFHSCANFSRNGATIINSYYLTEVQIAADNQQGIKKTQTEFEDGTVASLLGDAWKQDGTDIVLNEKAIDVNGCASGEMKAGTNEFEVDLTVPSKYINGTEIENEYDLYVGIYDSNGNECVAPAIQTKGASVEYTLTAPATMGIFSVEFILKNGNDVLTTANTNVLFGNELKLSTTEQTYNLSADESITVYDNGGSIFDYNDNIDYASFIVNLPEDNDMLIVSGDHWLEEGDNLNLKFADKEDTTTVLIEGACNSKLIDPITTNPGENLTIEFANNKDGQDKGGFGINIKVVTKLSVNSSNDTYGKTTINNADVNAEYLIDVNSKTFEIAAVAEDGYEFKQWNDGNTDATRTITVTKTTAYTATFSPLEEPDLDSEITFIVDGSDDKVITVNNGDMPSYGDTDPTKEATAQYTYTFTGWLPELVEATEDASYTAQFSETLNEYTVTFHINDGENNTTTTQTFEYGVTEALDKTTFTRAGYNFRGWASTANASAATYSEGADYSTTGNADLYAVWEEAVTTSMENTKVAPFTRVQNTLFFVQPTSIALYNATGMMLYTGSVNQYTLPSAAGVYLLKTAVGSFKITTNE